MFLNKERTCIGNRDTYFLKDVRYPSIIGTFFFKYEKAMTATPKESSPSIQIGFPRRV
jgi:hypothetical protein